MSAGSAGEAVRRGLVEAALGSGDRRAVPTPALVLDVDALDANVELMARRARDAGLDLRPHAKSHKSAFVARRQLEAGAVGLSCAKLAEAEALVSAVAADGYDRRLAILLTSPLANDAAARRAARLAGRCDLSVVVDHPDGVDELARALAAGGVRARVLCDVDVGLARTGVVDSRHALAVAERAADHGSTDFVGVQGYGGHLQHIAGRDERRAATAAASQRLALVVGDLVDAGYGVGVVTGGGTGTAGLDAELGLLTELQAGSYVFMDREYADALGADPEGEFAQSLTIETTVVSANHDGHVTVDAGLKSMATDAGPPRVLWPRGTGDYHFFGDEHGMIVTDPSLPLRRGDRVALVPPHCDPTVDRYDLLWLVRADELVGVAEVSARGCSQ